jgi:elongation factor G
MKVEVFAGQEHINQIITEMSTNRQAYVHSVGPESILAHVPLIRLVGYSTALRSLTKGEGTFTMLLHGYQFVGSQEQDELVRTL